MMQNQHCLTKKSKIKMPQESLSSLCFTNESQFYFKKELENRF